MTQTLNISEVLDTAREIIADVLDDIDTDAMWPASVEEIESKSRDGFIAFTDGGWDGVVTFGLHQEVSDCVKLIRPYVEHDAKWAEEEFRRQESLDDNAEIDWDSQEWQDFIGGWEQDEDADLWFVKARVLYFTPDNHRNQSGEDEMLFCFGVNDDFGYGRDSISWCKGVGTTWLWETEVKLSELNDEKIAEIKAAMLQAWKDC